jgi:hypothetical protein
MTGKMFHVEHFDFTANDLISSGRCLICGHIKTNEGIICSDQFCNFIYRNEIEISKKPLDVIHENFTESLKKELWQKSILID